MVTIEYNLRIGLEIHIPLSTVETKLFCPCPNPFKHPPERPNQYVCPTCLGLPGALPSPNREAIRKAILLAKALKMEIPSKIQFYRKHYLYPDLPKGYQITQYMAGGDLPIGIRGGMLFRDRYMGIRRIQLEEDPARLEHPGGLGESSRTLIDYNRSGAPLIELVTEPEIYSPREARIFIEELTRLLVTIGVISEDTQPKVDANISIEGGPRVEIKNISSPRDVEKALSYEAMRMARYMEEGIEIRRETRHWDDMRRVTIPLREKEYEEEYRYIPDPNLPPIDISDMIAEVEEPETPLKILERIIRDGVDVYPAKIIASDRRLLRIYREASEGLGRRARTELAKTLVNEAKHMLNTGKTVEELIETMKPLYQLVDKGIITPAEAREKLLGRRGLKLADQEEILKTVDKVLREVDTSRRRSIDYVVGTVLRRLRERGLDADPRSIAEYARGKIETPRKIEVRRARDGEDRMYKGVAETPRPVDPSELPSLVGSEVVIGGWLETRAYVGDKLFLRLRHWRGTVQVVAHGDSPAYRELSRLPREAYIVVRGRVVRDSRAPGGLEIHASEVIPVGTSTDPPLTLMDLARSSLPTRVRHRYLDIRRRRVRAVLYIRARLLEIVRSLLTRKGFVEIQTPTIIASATEGGAELFPLIYYGREAFLAQSPQLYKQMAINAFEKVFEIDSYYRAQKFDTPRHLAEFWSLDVEAAHHGLGDLISLAREILLEIHRTLPSKAGDELMLLGVELEPEPSFAEMSYDEAVEISGTRYGEDISAEALREVYKEANARYLFITHWPEETRAFYYRSIDGITRSFDLVGPFTGTPIELASGGERINSYDELVRSIRRRGLREESYGWYLEMFRYGMPPHGGFGLGIDRLLASILGLDSVLEATLIPRTPKYYVP